MSFVLEFACPSHIESFYIIFRQPHHQYFASVALITGFFYTKECSCISLFLAWQTASWRENSPLSEFLLLSERSAYAYLVLRGLTRSARFAYNLINTSGCLGTCQGYLDRISSLVCYLIILQEFKPLQSINQSINQSITQISILPISQAKPGSVSIKYL